MSHKRLVADLKTLIIELEALRKNFTYPVALSQLQLDLLIPYLKQTLEEEKFLSDDEGDKREFS